MTIDLLECSHGPMRIRQHDVQPLVNIVHSCFVSESLQKQQVSGDDCSHPGDVYHPDFQHGRPARSGTSAQVACKKLLQPTIIITLVEQCQDDFKILSFAVW